MMKRIKKIMNQIRQTAESFAHDDSGIGVVEIILILVILIGLVLIFKNQITAIIGSAFDSINVNSNTIVN